MFAGRYSYGADAVGCRDQFIPCDATGIDDRLVCCVDAIAEVVTSQELPDILDGIEFGRIRRQMEQANIVRHHQPIAQLVPSSTVQRQHREGPLVHLGADFLQMQVHGVDIGVRQHQPCTDASRWADSAERIGPFVTLIAWHSGPGTTLCPDAGQAALLTNPRFVLPPQLDWLPLCDRRNGGGNQIGEVFLCASCAAASA